MSPIDHFLPVLQSYQEIQSALNLPISTPHRIGKLFAADLLDEITDASSGATLPLGLSDDGLPVRLDLYDPAPGPLLVAGDGGSGKTGYLKFLAQASNRQDPGEIEFGVITPFPEEWAAEESLPNGLGIWPAYHPAASDFLAQLVCWTEALPKSRQVVLLLVDGLDLLSTGDFLIQKDLRWLLMHGPARQIWPVVTVNPGRLQNLKGWMDYFKTRILGQVRREQTAQELLVDTDINLGTLKAGMQFGLSSPDGWKKFWLPNVDKGD